MCEFLPMNRQFFRRPLCIFALLCLGLSLPVKSSAQTIVHQVTLPSGVTWCDDGMINGLLTQVNTFRGQNGLAALAMDRVGMKDAETRAPQFAAYMATHVVGSPGFNPHEGYDTTAAGLGYDIVSENLAYLTSDPAYIVYSVWQDTLHLNAMLARDATIAGVSCVYSYGSPYWTYEPARGAVTPIPTPAPTPTPTLDSEEWAFLTLINSYRAQNGAGPLQVSVALQNSSAWMCNDMATKNYAGHTDSLGRSAQARINAFGYPYSPWGENISGGWSDAQTAFTQWVNACDPDPSGNCTFAHRLNMANPNFAVMGIGRAYSASSTYGWYWTTDFGGTVDRTISPNPVPTPGPGPSKPVITSFAANLSNTTAGQPVTLSWVVSGATALSVDNGVGNVTNYNSATVAPLQSSTYNLTATNSAGSSTAAVRITVTPAGDTLPPTVPVLVSANAKSSAEVDLVWTASTDNVGVAGYQITRNGSVIASVPGYSLGYVDTSVGANSTYGYTLKAYDAAGNYSTPSNSMQVTTPAPLPVAGACPAPATNAFTGCYYNNNMTLSGNPVFVRTDSRIYFDWGAGSPDASLPSYNFSARWQGNFTFGQGNYTFTAIISDGMRLYIDGNLILDRWRDEPPLYYTVSQNVTQGTHLVVVEYYERTGGATAQVWWQNNSPGAQVPVISSFTASPQAITAGQPVTLSWYVSGATAVSIDNGVGDVTTKSSIIASPTQSSTYTLTASSSAGVITSLVKVTVTPASDSQPPTVPSIVSAMAKSATEVDLVWAASTDNVGVAGYQVLRNGNLLAFVGAATLAYSDTTVTQNSTYTYAVKAYDAAGNYSAASNGVRVSTPAPPVAGTCPAPATNAFTGCYFNNTTLSGNPVLVRTDSQINFDWGSGTPDNSMTPYNYSARWQGNFTFSQGNYTFNVITSDGTRLYVDGNLVLDRWRDQPPYYYTVAQSLSQGTHLITVEYYEHTGGATAQVFWRQN